MPVQFMITYVVRSAMTKCGTFVTDPRASINEDEAVGLREYAHYVAEHFDKHTYPDYDSLASLCHKSLDRSRAKSASRCVKHWCTHMMP